MKQIKNHCHHYNWEMKNILVLLSGCSVISSGKNLPRNSAQFEGLCREIEVSTRS